MLVAEERVAWGEGGGGGVGEDLELRLNRRVQFLDGDGRAGHLHQRKNALLHPRAARRSEDDIGALMRDRVIDALDKGRAYAHAHGAAHESEILHAHDERHVVDSAARVDERILIAGRGARGPYAVGIAFGVAKLERIFRDMRGRQQDETGVEYLAETLIGADPTMMVAAWADREIFFPFLDEDHFSAGRAFVPQHLGCGFLLGDERQGVANAVDPAHAAVSWA